MMFSYPVFKVILCTLKTGVLSDCIKCVYMSDMCCKMTATPVASQREHHHIHSIHIIVKQLGLLINDRLNSEQFSNHGDKGNGIFNTCNSFIFTRLGWFCSYHLIYRNLSQ